MGEFISLTAEDGHQFDCYKVDPAGTPKAGLIVIQEIFGVNSHIREVAEGYAADGYAVQPETTVPENTLEVVVNRSGQIFARIDGQTELQELGQRQVTDYLRKPRTTEKDKNKLEIAKAKDSQQKAVNEARKYQLELTRM